MKILKHYTVTRVSAIVLATIWIAILTLQVSAQTTDLQPLVFVSADSGSDANNCSRSAPCRQVSRALEAVSSSGTVLIIAGGDYERFTISASVSIIAESGVTAIIKGATESSAIRIDNDRGSSLRIRLIGLTVEAAGSLSRAIMVTAETRIGLLQIENCTVKGLLAGATFNGPGDYSIKNSRFYGGVSNLEFSSAGAINAVVESSNITLGGGLRVGSNAKVLVRDTVVSHATGFLASGTGARLFIENCVSNNNSGDGVMAHDSAFVRISNSTISFNNGYGIRVDGGNMKSFGNNRLFSNRLGETSGTVGQLSQQ